MILPLLILAATSEQPSDAQRSVSYALTILNNYVAAISFSDACLRRSDMRALEPFQDRIEQARRRAVTAFPALTGVEASGDTDFVCRRTSEPKHVSKRAIRRKIVQLLADLEATLGPSDTNVR